MINCNKKIQFYMLIYKNLKYNVNKKCCYSNLSEIYI